MANKMAWLSLRIFFLTIIIVFNSFIVSSQVEPQGTRDVIRVDLVNPDEFAKNRSKTKPHRKKVTRKQPKNKTNNESTMEEEVSLLGVTIWKLRPSAKEDAYRVIDIVGSESKDQMTPERVISNDPIEEGSFIRLSLEIPNKSYIYVFNREQYTENSYGSKVYLIYPIKGTNGLEDNNLVEAGQLLFLPRQKESYFFRTSAKGKEEIY